jgi:hypothetical protein
MKCWLAQFSEKPCDGRWEEWVVTVDAADRASALAKVLRRRGQAAYLLGGDRFRFQAQKIR